MKVYLLFPYDLRRVFWFGFESKVFQSFDLILAQLISCAFTNHPLGVIVVGVVVVVDISIVDKLTCKLSAWISRD